MGKMHCFSTEGTHAASFQVVLQSDVITSALYWSNVTVHGKVLFLNDLVVAEGKVLVA